MKNYWCQFYDRLGNSHELWYTEEEFFVIKLSCSPREYNWLYFPHVDDYIKRHAELIYHNELVLI